MKQSILVRAASAALLGAAVFVGSAQAAPRLCDDGSRPPCHDTGEAAANNLSYPVIWSDGVSTLTPLPFSRSLTRSNSFRKRFNFCSERKYDTHPAHPHTTALGMCSHWTIQADPARSGS